MMLVDNLIQRAKDRLTRWVAPLCCPVGIAGRYFRRTRKGLQVWFRIPLSQRVGQHDDKCAFLLLRTLWRPLSFLAWGNCSARVVIVCRMVYRPPVRFLCWWQGGVRGGLHDKLRSALNQTDLPLVLHNSIFCQKHIQSSSNFLNLLLIFGVMSVLSNKGDFLGGN